MTCLPAARNVLGGWVLSFGTASVPRPVRVVTPAATRARIPARIPARIRGQILAPIRGLIPVGIRVKSRLRVIWAARRTPSAAVTCTPSSAPSVTEPPATVVSVGAWTRWKAALPALTKTLWPATSISVCRPASSPNAQVAVHGIPPPTSWNSSSMRAAIRGPILAPTRVTVEAPPTRRRSPLAGWISSSRVSGEQGLRVRCRFTTSVVKPLPAAGP